MSMRHGTFAIALSLPEEWGGLGFSMTEIAPCYEEMNRSIFGPVCFNASAPDDGNMRVLRMKNIQSFSPFIRNREKP